MPLVDFQRRRRRGVAYGTWTADVSPWLLAYSLGVEWDPEATLDSDRANAGRPAFKGRYFSSLPDASPTLSDPALNAFGLDFNNPDIGNNDWSSYLAGLDSDGDGCTNGAEIGDVDGNGHPDNGVEQESSNPGLEGDCSSASVFEEATWGQLKSMFNTR